MTPNAFPDGRQDRPATAGQPMTTRFLEASSASVATVDAWLKRAQAHLQRCEVPESVANAELLMGAVLDCARLQVRALGMRPLNLRQSRIFWQRVLQRGRRIPLAYVLGRQAFMDFEVEIAPSVLIPRPETECLVEAAIHVAKTGFPCVPSHILEIGTGSGCVSIALARALNSAMLYATDISSSALAIAKENSRRLGVDGRIRFIREDLFRASSAGARPWADIIVSNPPYIPTREIPALSPEVLREPVLALDGGSDGLEAIRAIVAEAPGKLKAGGWLLLEIGDSQAPAVQELLEPRFTAMQFRKDLQGQTRIALAQAL